MRRVVEAGQQLYQRRFAVTVATDEGDTLARGNAQVQAVEHQATTRIREGHVLEDDSLPHRTRGRQPGHGRLHAWTHFEEMREVSEEQ
jgi:hypothetical protein